MAKKIFTIFAVSDATGELAHNLAIAAYRQFEEIQAKIYRRPHVRTEQKIHDVVTEAKQAHGIILFTMVSQEVRRKILSEAQAQNIIAMDVMGPVLDLLANYFHKLPSAEPGLQYKITQEYFKRTEAVEFTVQHDEGSNLNTLDQADIILLGISRTSKTPLSIFLAYHGYRCANIPIVLGVPIPEKIYDLDRKKIVGLILSSEKLSEMRTERLRTLGRPNSEDYAQMEHIINELKYAQDVFEKLGSILIVDVTGKAIEEIASEIISKLSL